MNAMTEEFFNPCECNRENYPWFLSRLFWNFKIIVLSLHRHSCRSGMCAVEWWPYMIRRLLDALFLTLGNFASLTAYFINIWYSCIFAQLQTFKKQNRNKSDEKHDFVPLPVSLAFFPVRYLHFCVWMKKR